FPSRKSGEHFHGGGSGIRMRIREDEEIRLKVSYFFQANLWPALIGIHHRNGSGATQGVSDEGVLANGDERLGPDDEQNALGGKRSKALLQIGQTALPVTSDGL